jgi:hypothetical protein
VGCTGKAAHFSTPHTLPHTLADRVQDHGPMRHEGRKGAVLFPGEALPGPAGRHSLITTSPVITSLRRVTVGGSHPADALRPKRISFEGPSSTLRHAGHQVAVGLAMRAVPPRGSGGGHGGDSGGITEPSVFGLDSARGAHPRRHSTEEGPPWVSDLHAGRRGALGDRGGEYLERQAPGPGHGLPEYGRTPRHSEGDLGRGDVEALQQLARRQQQELEALKVWQAQSAQHSLPPLISHPSPHPPSSLLTYTHACTPTHIDTADTHTQSTHPPGTSGKAYAATTVSLQLPTPLTWM